MKKFVSRTRWEFIRNMYKNSFIKQVANYPGNFISFKNNIFVEFGEDKFPEYKDVYIPNVSISSTSSTKRNIVPMIMGKPVLKIEKLCELLDIDIPLEYQDVAENFFTETELFESISRRDQISLELELKEDLSKGYYKGLKIATEKFKNRFLNVSGSFKKTNLKMLEMFVEWQYAFRTRGFWFQDYFDYHLYNRSIEEAEKFINADYRHKIADVATAKGYMKYFSSKPLFNETFAKYVKRDFLNMRECTIADFKEFSSKHPIFFGKPHSGTGGFGAGIWSVKEGNLEEVYEECKDQDLILEEIVKQNKELAELNNDTLNTARIYSLLKIDDEPIITLATIRMGRKGSVVDNFHSGGIGAAVNVETGIIYTEAIDLNGNRYLEHPDSGKQIKGFQLPNWDKVIEAVKDAAMFIPQVRHIGWDIAFTESGEIEFMEGNTKANFHIPQSADQIGKKSLYEKHIDELFAKKQQDSALLKLDFEYEEVDDQIKITKYIGQEKNLEIPETIKSKEVAIIGAEAFANHPFLERIVIPENVGTINRAAFANCEKLKKVVLPSKLQVINQSTFENCKSLTSVRIPYFLKRLCTNAFKGCLSLKEIYHYSMQAIGSPSMWEDFSSKELELPTRIEYIGKYAFEGCESLTEVVIPWKVDVLNEGIFKNCSSLSKVYSHNLLKEIKKKAFQGCLSLRELKLPLLTKKIALDAIPRNIMIVCEESSYVAKFAQSNKLPVKLISNKLPEIVSNFVPSKKKIVPFSNHTPFYTDNEVLKYIEKFEMRPPSYKIKRKLSESLHNEISSSRYQLEEGVYVNKNKKDLGRAIIRMTGDLMCRRLQQKAAKDSNGNYDFENCFYFVNELLKNADFSIGNLETSISPSAPLQSEVLFMNNTANFNAPEEYLYALRNASFDALNNAQNHIYDTGLRGIFETLDMQNKYQFMHLGAYASEYDKRYLMVEINGIKVAFLAYFDVARQQMKKANFTKLGREVMTNTFSSGVGGNKQVVADVENAKSEGAEFIIAFCHWGKEYSNEISKRQGEFASMVANAGVDYMFGAHPHCLQPYDIIVTNDGREVPVFYSAGNFISDMNIQAPITRDSLIGELILTRDDSGKVVIEKTGFYPCRIVSLNKEGFNYVVMPTSFGNSDDNKISKNLIDAQERIVKVLGKKAKVLPLQLKEDHNMGSILKNLGIHHNISEIKNKEILAVPRSRIFKVDEICDMLKIKIPKEYQHNSSDYIHKTNFFKKLESSLQSKWDIKLRNDFANDYYDNLKKFTRSFKIRYNRSNLIKSKSDKDLFEKYVEWKYQYHPLGFAHYDYFDYKLFNKSIKEAKKFIDREYKFKIFKLTTQSDYRKYFKNKLLFNQTFSEFVKRDYLDVGQSTIKEFEDFVTKHPKFFAKPIDGLLGKGAEIIEISSNEYCKIYDYCKDNKMIIEELVKQHNDLESFNPDSVNTLRIIVLLDAKDSPIITFAGIRVGRKGFIVDNVTAGGMVAAIDIDTGVISTNAIDKVDYEYEAHPDTGKRFKGSKIPHWEDIISQVKKATLVIPQQRHVGWDVTITDKGVVEFIEGNATPNLRAAQFADQVGKKYLYEPIINEIINSKKEVETKEKEWQLNKDFDQSIRTISNEILTIDESRVFTISEICKMLDIKVPAQYVDIENQLVINTSLFTSIENHSNLLQKLKIRKDFEKTYYDKLKYGKRSAKAFHKRYKNSVLMDYDESDLLKKFVHHLYLFRPLDFTSPNYFDFRLYDKSLEEAEEFVSLGYNNFIYNTCNKGARTKYRHCSDKAIFNKKAKKYVNRHYLDARSCTLKEFTSFVNKHPKIFAKPFNSIHGKGAEILELSGSVEKLFRYCKDQEMMVEELITQHTALSSLNECTVNTIRLLTLLPLNNIPIITFAVIRVGRVGNIVDNVSAGGLTAAINVKTGRVFTNAYDQNDNEFTHHPDSGIELKDFQIPHWNKVVNAVKETAREFPLVRHIGWDIAITIDGDVEFIEGNDQPSFRAIQMLDQVGKKHLYKNYIDELRASNWREALFEENLGIPI